MLEDRPCQEPYTNQQPTSMSEVQFPITHFSPSSLSQLLRNPLIFKMKYILGVYDSKIGVSGMIGRAVHEALKAYYGANDDVPMPVDQTEARGIARQVGLDYLESQNEEYISYGKTSSREDMLKGYTQAMDFYFAEEPKYYKLQMVEEKMKGEILSLNGEPMPIPAVAVPDIVHLTRTGSIEIIDLKVVSSFTNYDEEDYIKIIQGIFLKRLLKSTKGIDANRILFRELKRTKNKDGMPQIRDYVIPFDHEPYDIIFDNLYKDAVKFVSNPDAIYLPNLSDMFDGQHAGMIYAQGLISSDMSDVEVMHKVRDIAFVSKKFVASRLDSEINKHLLPEEKVKMRLAEFGIPVEPVETKAGASVTQYRFKVSAGVKMATIKKHKDDIARALETKGEVRIIAPIPGTSLIGIEVENPDRQTIKRTKGHIMPGSMKVAIGQDVNDEVVWLDLPSAPHLLIAGATGSGKSVLVHNIISALVKQMPAEEMNLILIDPKRVELARFAKKPHLLGQGVIYEYKDAVAALQRLTDTMEERYKILEKAGKRDLGEYNASKKKPSLRLPHIVVVFDEFADFILRSAKVKNKERMVDMEQLIVRLASMGRAAGIHLILATQRPSVDVITGLIKANIPTRIALATASRIDSEIILGKAGAEKLAGKGDMLYMHPTNRGEIRLQGFSE